MKISIAFAALVAVSIAGVVWYTGAPTSEPRLTAESVAAPVVNDPVPNDQGTATENSETYAKPLEALPPLDGGKLDATPPTPLAAFRATLAGIKSQPYDEAWAKKTGAQLSASFSAILSSQRDAGQAPVLRDIDCHQTACVITIEWPSFNEASAGWESLLRSPIEPNCDREIVLDESLAAQAPYRGQVAVTNCSPS